LAGRTGNWNALRSGHRRRHLYRRQKKL